MDFLQSSSPLRALSLWFLDVDHAVLPVTRDRLCVDVFIAGLGWLFALALGGFATYATVFDFGLAATPYHAVVAGLSFGLVVLLPFGEWALAGSGHQVPGMRHHRPVEVYGYMVGLWWLTLGVLWTGIADYAQIQEGKQFIDENWYILQVQVPIPFTTQLDSKMSFEFNCKVILGLSIVTSFLMLPSLLEAWRALGGGLHMVQLKFGALLLEAVPLLILTGLTAGYAGYAADISAFESPYGPDALLWQTAMCGLALLAILLGIAATAMWGISFATHTVIALVLIIPAFVVFVTSLVTLERANEVSSFVGPRWETLRHFVSPAYSALSAKKYAAAAFTPMVEASNAGILLAFLLFASVIFHLNAAATIHSVGSELYVLKTNLLRQRAALLRVARGQAATVEDAALALEPVDSDPLIPLMAAIGDMVPGSGGAAPPSTGSGKPPSREKSSLFPTAYGTGYGSIGSGGGGGGGVEEEGERREAWGARRGADEQFQDVDDPVSSLSARGGGASSRSTVVSTSGSSESTALRGAVVSDVAGLTSARAVAERRIAAWRQSQQLAVDYEAQLKALAPRIKWPQWAVFASTLKSDMNTAWSGHWKCIMGTAVACVIAICGMAGGLAAIAADAVCYKLVGANGAASSTGSISVPLALNIYQSTGGDPYPPNAAWVFAALSIDHSYPLGSVEVFALEPTFPSTPRSVLIEATYFASSSSDLPANVTSTLLAATDATGYLSEEPPSGAPSDLFNPGYANISLKLTPPSGAAPRCLGVNLRIYVDSLFLVLNITSKSSAVWVYGNANATNGANTAGFLTLSAVTDSAPVVMTNVWADYLTIGPNAITDEYNATHRAPHFPPALSVVSNTGYVSLDTILSTGVYARSGGNLRSNTVVSTQASRFSGIGDYILTATGYARIIITQAVGAYSAAFSSDAGAIIIANSGFIVGTTIDINSNRGPIYLNNFIQVACNETRVSTGGLVSASAVFANALYISTRGNSNVNAVVVFLGLLASAAPVPFIPPLIGNYSYPGLFITTETGDVSVLSAGNNPSSETFADLLALHIASRDGRIKMEINGGGVNGNYSISSGAGSSIMEIDGNAVGNTGVLGVKAAINPNVYSVLVRSETDNVQVAVLASPL